MTRQFNGTAEAPTGSLPEDQVLVDRLREGDEAAFEAVIQRYHGSMVGVATRFVESRAVAEEAAQDAWMGVLRSLPGFEGRSSFRTWLFRILTNTAMSRGGRESRTIAFSSIGDGYGDQDSFVDPDRFLPSDSGPLAGHWASVPRAWDSIPDERLVAGETRAIIGGVMTSLPLMQREVLRLRDVEGHSSEEVCELLGLTSGNQRVLLHRARSRVRAELERHLQESDAEVLPA